MARQHLTALMRRFGVTARAVRFYEEEGLITVGRDRRNFRVYDQEAQARLAQIVELRRCGLGLPEIREALNLQQTQSGADTDYILSHLTRHRDQVRDELAAIDRQIETLKRDRDRQARAAGRTGRERPRDEPGFSTTGALPA